jgi:hypothetical protein
MFLIVLLGLLAMAAVVLLIVLAAGAIAGAWTGAAIGGALAGVWPAPRYSLKADPAGLAAGWRKALYIVLGILVGGLIGALAGVGLVVVALLIIASTG